MDSGKRTPAALRTIVYENWDKGEWGSVGATNAPAGSFESLNMVVYKNGLLGPRHGAKNLAFTGTVNGVVHGLGWRGTPIYDLWYIQTATVRSGNSRSVGSAITTWTPALDATPIESPQWVEFADDSTYVTNYNDKTYRFDHLTQTVSALSGSPGGRGIAFYGDRMIVGGTAANLYRCFISATNDPDDWSDGEFFDVPNQSGAIMALWTQRNHLTIWTQNGEWWTVTGAAGTDSAFLRRVSGGGQHPWNANANRGAALPSDDILHIPLTVDTPALFNGAVTQVLDYMTINDQDAPDSITEIKVLRGMRPDEGVIVFPTTGRIGLFYNNVWTFHKFDTGQIPTITQFFASDEQGQILFTDGGGVSTPPKFYTWTINQVEHPGYSTSSLSRVGDASETFFDAWVNFPEYWVPEGYELRIRSVIVDIKEWDSGATLSNRYTITPRSLNRWNDPSTALGYVDGTPLSYSQAVTDWTAGVGTSRRHRNVHLFGTADAYAGGFQLRVSGIGGLAFQAIRVDAEVRAEIPRR